MNILAGEGAALLYAGGMAVFALNAVKQKTEKKAGVLFVLGWLFWLGLGCALCLKSPQNCPYGKALLAFGCMAAFFQDLRTRYFAPAWLLVLAAGTVTALFCLPELTLPERLCGLLPACLCLPALCLRQLGSADVWFIAAAGFVLGLQPVLWMIMEACLLGLAGVWLFWKKEKLVPLISCLTVAFVTALLGGF